MSRLCALRTRNGNRILLDKVQTRNSEPNLQNHDKLFSDHPAAAGVAKAIASMHMLQNLLWGKHDLRTCVGDVSYPTP